ncbi:MAG: hypothetical protein JWQ72_3103 [Polaromonas sp.]|nr:hypothetical protein [Polaromonas sp.]
MTVFITHFLKKAGFDALLRCLAACCLVVLLVPLRPATAAELGQLKLERGDDGIYLSALVEFELPAVVEDALLKGIPMFFVVEADVYQSRWYWTDRRVASATRTIRLAFQPLTRRWRVNIATGLINSSAGIRATLNQNYDTLPEALSAVQRLSRWRIADGADLDPDLLHKLEFSFRLDLSQLPRPFQIGVAGQKDWNISVEQVERVQIAAPRPAPVSADKVRLPASAPVKEAER